MSIMTVMTIKNINSSTTAFFIERGELSSSLCYDDHSTLYEAMKEPMQIEQFESFYEIIIDFIKAFGPVMDSLIHNLDQLEGEDKANCERAVKALWNGDAETQNRLSKLFKKKVSKKPETKKKDPAKFFKKIGPEIRKALREMKKKKIAEKKAEKEAKKEKANSPQVIFKKKVSPELKKAVKEKKKVKVTKKKVLKLLVKTLKGKKAIAKKALAEAKKAAKALVRAEKEAMKKLEEEMEVRRPELES